MSPPNSVVFQCGTHEVETRHGHVTVVCSRDVTLAEIKPTLTRLVFNQSERKAYEQ